MAFDSSRPIKEQSCRKFGRRKESNAGVQLSYYKPWVKGWQRAARAVACRSSAHEEKQQLPLGVAYCLGSWPNPASPQSKTRAQMSRTCLL